MAFQATLEQLQNIDLAELDFASIGVWPLPVRVALLALLALVVLSGAYFFHIKDLNTRLDTARLQEQQLRQEFETKAFEAANLDAYRRQMAELEASFEVLRAQFPSDTEVPGLLEDITGIGLGSSLNITSIELQPERAAELYVELPIMITARGGYHDFGSFISGVAGLSRIVTLHDFDIASAEEGGLLAMNIEARTYRYKSQDE